MPVTVRHTPLTATLSPSDRSGPSVARMLTRNPDEAGVIALTCPTVSMRPVNITFDQHVRADLLDSPLVKCCRREISPGEQRHALIS